MSISDEQLAHLETLARIALDDGERESVREDLGAVLAYFDSLSRLDTEGVEELVRPVPLSNVLREDETRESLPRSTALALGVETEAGFFKVPRTVEEDG
ncbi:MAG: Asp-tRNA(Asn)/Glu-tRNA(Gln) amidotransferase subunit GatC [Trueperaceae bacterium]